MSTTAETGPSGPPAARRASLRVAGALLAAAAALTFRPYLGLFGDARIYVGRAVATLDPAGVGRDLMFVHDRQSAFSAFPAGLTGLVALLGPTAASMATALCALTVWTLSAAGLLTAFAGRRAALLSLLCVLVLPSAYGGFQITIGEAAPLPRPFAEALVLLGLWALMRGRRVTAVLLMAAAAVVHPIMALPGLGVLYLTLCQEDRRWLVLALAGGAAAAAGAALGLPLLDRLPVAMDGRWLDVLRSCSPFLLLQTWPADAWCRVVVRAATLGLAAVLLEGLARRVAVAVLGAAALALAASALLGDVASSVLVVQAQLWRGLWLLSFLASAALPIVALRLWARGPVARLAVGALACAWITPVLAPISAGAAVAAVSLFLIGRSRPAASRPLLLLGWALVAVGAGLALTGYAWSLLDLTWGVPEALRQPLRLHLLQDTPRAVAGVALIAALAAWGRRRLPARTAMPAAALLVLAAAAGWRSPSASRRLLESPVAAREVRAIVASRPGEVEWLGGDLEPTMLAGRPIWWTEVQAASSVFSRDQALIWAARRRRMVEAGVGPPVLLDPFPREAPSPFWTPSPAALRGFCAAPDAPAWIVEALRSGARAPAGATLWRAPIAVSRNLKPGGPAQLVAAYAFIPCGPAPPPPA